MSSGVSETRTIARWASIAVSLRVVNVHGLVGFETIEHRLDPALAALAVWILRSAMLGQIFVCWRAAPST